VSCPTCDHTMARCGVKSEKKWIFICGRCGTMACDGFVSVPEIVERARALADLDLSDRKDLSTGKKNVIVQKRKRDVLECVSKKEAS